MIGVTAAFNFITAVFANKIFYSSLKKFHYLVRPEGIEPPITVPKTVVISVSPRTLVITKFFGGVAGTRTQNQLLKRQLLYQLSYHSLKLKH